MCVVFHLRVLRLRQLMKLPSDTLLGQYLQYFTLIMAASIAAVYTCGYTFGLFVHQLNDKCTQLAKVFVSMRSRFVQVFGIS
jgi:hypothetical protein